VLATVFHRRELLLSADLAVTKFVALTQPTSTQTCALPKHEFSRAHAARCWHSLPFENCSSSVEPPVA
jgi:hypothetical protein